MNRMGWWRCKRIIFTFPGGFCSENCDRRGGNIRIGNGTGHSFEGPWGWACCLRVQRTNWRQGLDWAQRRRFYLWRGRESYESSAPVISSLPTNVSLTILQISCLLTQINPWLLIPVPLLRVACSHLTWCDLSSYNWAMYHQTYLKHYLMSIVLTIIPGYLHMLGNIIIQIYFCWAHMCLLCQAMPGL